MALMARLRSFFKSNSRTFSILIKKDVPRFAICGSGISGLTLASILSNTLGNQVQINVFERAAADRDQGYGLDLDMYGQEALVRAGVHNRYWEISRPKSDSQVAYSMRDSEKPLAIIFRPYFLRYLLPKYFGARPESNRGKLRDILLDSLKDNDNVEVHFETPTSEICEIETSDFCKRAEVFGPDNKSLGTYDLVIDAMGLHSPFRQHRVHDDVGKHYVGEMMIHGVIENPEESWSKELLDKFGTCGTMIIPGRGYAIVLQRFGVDSTSEIDNRTCLFYMKEHKEGEDGVYSEMGLTKPKSRSDGIIADDERLNLVKKWILDDMGDQFDPIWSEVIDSLDRVTVRGDYSHGETTLKESVTLPLVCIGDSQRNCGLGGGGNIAMQDAIELSELLEKEVKQYHQESHHSFNLDSIRELEISMLARKEEFTKDKKKRSTQMKSRVEKVGRGPLTLDDIGIDWKVVKLIRMFGPMLSSLLQSYYRWELRNGYGGSDQSSPLYPNVKQALKLYPQKELRP